MTPTLEQQAIISAYSETSANLLIEARAGAAKTTTLRMLINAEKRPSLYLAFNRSVVMEAKTKVEPRCKVLTLNGIGHQTLARQLGVKVELDKSKTFKLLREADYRGNKFGEMLASDSPLQATRLHP